jgi:hypothetical protein
MKSIEQTIIEHNLASSEVEAQYEKTRDVISNELVRIMELRRMFLGFEMRIMDECAKFQKELSEVANKFKISLK